MRKLIIALILMIAGTNLVYAGHDDNRGAYDNIARAAHQLEGAAGRLQKQLRHDWGFNHATRDAAQLAQAARHFRHEVKAGERHENIRGGYRDLADAYAQVRNEFGRRQDLRRDRHLRRPNSFRT